MIHIKSRTQLAQFAIRIASHFAFFFFFFSQLRRTRESFAYTTFFFLANVCVSINSRFIPNSECVRALKLERFNIALHKLFRTRGNSMLRKSDGIAHVVVTLTCTFKKRVFRIIGVIRTIAHRRVRELTSDFVTCHVCKSSRQFNYRTKAGRYCSSSAPGFVRLNLCCLHRPLKWFLVTCGSRQVLRAETRVVREIALNSFVSFCCHSSINSSFLFLFCFVFFFLSLCIRFSNTDRVSDELDIFEAAGNAFFQYARDVAPQWFDCRSQKMSLFFPPSLN